MSLKTTFSKVLNTIRNVLPLIEKYLPTASAIALATPWPHDDIALGAFQKVYEYAKKVLGNEHIQKSAAIGTQAIAMGVESGLSIDEAQEAMYDGIRLAIRANELKKAAREAIKKDGKVVVGEMTITKVDELKNVPKSLWRTLAQVEYVSNKT